MLALKKRGLFVPTVYKKFNFWEYSNRRILDMKPGDILIFHANLIHRGIFLKNIIIKFI